MAAMDLQGLRDFVLLSLDSDVEELPNSLIDVYIEEGFQAAIGVSDNWGFYHREESLVTTAGTQTYNFRGPDADLDDAFSYPYQSITDIRADTWSLTPLPHAEARRMFRRSSPSTSRPWGVSEHGDLLYLWPSPDDAYELTISGYRQPIDWIALGAGSQPDLPARYHQMLAYHALARGHAQLGDPEMALYYGNLFDAHVGAMKRLYATPSIAGPMIQNKGSGVSIWQQNGIGPPIYDWI